MKPNRELTRFFLLGLALGMIMTTGLVVFRFFDNPPGLRDIIAAYIAGFFVGLFLGAVLYFGKTGQFDAKAVIRKKWYIFILQYGCCYWGLPTGICLFLVINFIYGLKVNFFVIIGVFQAGGLLFGSTMYILAGISTKRNAKNGAQ